MMETGDVVDLLLQGNQLKRTARTGWVQRGIAGAESVAAHTYGVAFATLVLSYLLEEPIDLGRALAMAVLHDLPESVTGDITTPAWRYLPGGLKEQVERAAMDDIVGDDPIGPNLLDLWEEFQTAETVESRLVHDADKIDLLLQALAYEEQTGNRKLSEFWSSPAEPYLTHSTVISSELRARWEGLHGITSPDPPS